MFLSQSSNTPLTDKMGFPSVLQTVKNSPAMQKTQVQSLGQQDSLEKGMTTTSVFLSGEFHGQRAWRATVHDVAKSRTQLSD